MFEEEEKILKNLFHFTFSSATESAVLSASV
jgi:hypothetical protein